MLSLIFISITLLSSALFYWGTGKDKSVLIIYSLWTIAVGTLSRLGFFQNTQAVPPRILFVIAPAVMYVIYSYRKTETSRLQPSYLLAVHMVRLPVELILYRLFLLGKVPGIMTYKGWNFDILIGISAAILWLYSFFTKKAVGSSVFRAWNILGILSLSVIVIIAMLSAPSPVQQLAFDNPNLAISEFPYTLLPAVIVPTVLLSHLLCLKKQAFGGKKGTG